MNKLQDMISGINETVEKNDKEKSLRSFISEVLNEEYVISVSEWYENKEYMRPFLGLHNDIVPSLYIFTSPEIAFNFAEENKMVSVDGGCLAFKITPSRLIEMVEAYKVAGVEGLVIDQGADSIYISLSEFLGLLD